MWKFKILAGCTFIEGHVARYDLHVPGCSRAFGISASEQQCASVLVRVSERRGHGCKWPWQPLSSVKSFDEST